MAFLEWIQDQYSNYTRVREQDNKLDEEDYEISDDLVANNPALEQFKHPCRILLIGKPQSGKTTVAVKIISYLAPQVDRIYVCSPTYDKQPTWDFVDHLITRVFSYPDEALYEIDQKVAENPNTRFMLCLDDVSFEKILNEGSKGILSKLAYNGTWMNVTLCGIVHRPTAIGIPLRDAADHVLIFNLTNQKTIKTIAEEFSITGKTRDFIELYNEIVKQPIMSGSKPYAFMYISFINGQHIFNGFTEEILIGQDDQDLNYSPQDNQMELL